MSYRSNCKIIRHTSQKNIKNEVSKVKKITTYNWILQIAKKRECQPDKLKKNKDNIWYNQNNK
jgi:hypothetical protein